MTEFGYVEPIIWNEETGNIVGGHQRYKVLVAEGHTEVECVIVKIEYCEQIEPPVRMIEPASAINRATQRERESH